MKKSIAALLFVGALTGPLLGQDPEPYQFKEVKNLACTPVKNQQMTGTCWCFSTTSFIESELIRTGHGKYDLSEMFLVRHTYRKKAERKVTILYQPFTTPVQPTASSYRDLFCASDVCQTDCAMLCEQNCQYTNKAYH